MVRLVFLVKKLIFNKKLSRHLFYFIFKGKQTKKIEA